MRKYLLSFVIFFIFLPNVFGEIPREDLRVELILGSDYRDTSGNNRNTIIQGGIGPNLKNDQIYGIPHAQFQGSGGVKVNTAWSASGSDNFTISLWVKFDPASFGGHTGTEMVGTPFITQELRNGWLASVHKTYRTTLTQPIFINSSGSIGQNSLRLIISRDGQCSFRGSNINNDQFRYIYAQTNIGYAQALSDVTIQNFGNNMSEKFNCSKLIDNRWHNVILLKRVGTLSFFIDGREEFKINGAFDLGREITLGYSDHFSESAFSGSNYSAEQINVIRGLHSSQVSIASFRAYSRALNFGEVESLSEEHKYAQSELIGAGNIGIAIEQYTSPNLSIRLSNIVPNLSNNDVDYEYSTDGDTFYTITDLSDTSSGALLSYRASINMANIPDGRINITLRIRSGETFQNIGTIVFNKYDTPIEIIINHPDSTISTSKNISASTNTGNTLHMHITRGDKCDGSITKWEEYSDLTFAGKNDNGVRVCYRSSNQGTNKIIYRLSAIIQGIQSNEEQADSGYSLFKDYTLWQRSMFAKPNDSTAMVLELLNTSRQKTETFVHNSLSSYSLSTSNSITMTDINGDGLVDFLYHQSDPIRRAILINNGNFSFRVIYKCAIDQVRLGTSTINYTWVNHYFGDCADTTR